MAIKHEKIFYKAAGHPMPEVSIPQMPNKIFGNSGDGSEVTDYLQNQGDYSPNKTKGQINIGQKETIIIPAKKKLLPYKKYPGK